MNFGIALWVVAGVVLFAIIGFIVGYLVASRDLESQMRVAAKNETKRALESIYLSSANDPELHDRVRDLINNVHTRLYPNDESPYVVTQEKEENDA